MTNNPSSGSKSSSSSSPYHEASDLLNHILSSSSTSIQVPVHNHDDNQREQEQQEQRTISKMMNQLKRFVLHKKHHTLQVSTKTYAIVANVIQNLYIINTILYHTNIPQLQIHHHPTTNTNTTKNNKKNTNTNIKNIGLYYILLYELLLSKQQRMIGGGTIKRFILQYESILRQTMNDHHHKYIASTTTLPSSEITTNTTTTNPTTISFPRYIRINTCVTTVSNFMQQYNNFIIQQDEQYEHEHEHEQHKNHHKKNSYNNNNYNNNNTLMNHNLLYKDEHIPNLFIVSPKIISKLLHYFNTNHNNNNNNNNNNNCFILQDKSSCIPAFCLYSLLLLKQQQQQQQQKQNTSYGDIIDACAAPGNKTSHIASLFVQQQQQQQQQQQPSSTNTSTSNTKIPTIYAFDRDQSRYKTLHQRMEELVPSTITISSLESESEQQTSSSSSTTTTIHNCNIIVQHNDFLTINGDMYPTVTCIVLDPSCSGSGLYNRNHTSNYNNYDSNHTSEHEQRSYDPIMDVNDDNNKDIYDTKFIDRIQKLSGFQITCLRHAMTHFPNVHTIIYSTCSIYIYENEYVIASVLNDTNINNINTNSNDDNETTTKSTTTTNNLQNEWNVVAPPDLQSWKRRGCSKYVLDSNNTNTKVDHSNNDLQVKKDSTKNSSHNEFIQNVQTTIQNNLTMNDINCFIRTNYNDRTNGFFVACLQRKNNNNNTMSLSNTATSKTKKRKASSTMNDTSMNVQHDVRLQLENNDLYKNIPIYNGEYDNYNNNDYDHKKNDTFDAAAKNTTITPIASNDISKSTMINNNNHDTKSPTNYNRSKRKHSVIQVNDDYDDDTKTNNIISKRNTPSKNNKDNNKMKQPIQSTSKNTDIISTTTTISTNNNNVSNKKRTKKLQWKQRQHAAKVARTKKQPKNKLL